ncbi:GAF domain-containing protein [Flindersiella endophytica]
METGTCTRAVRSVVLESWRRSMRAGVDPGAGLPPVELLDDELEEYRSLHPLAAAIPVIRELLLSDLVQDRMIVVISDASGRLLWVDGDPVLRSRAEGIHLVEGANWREEYAGTNAVGAAIAVGQSMQVYASEHFRESVQPWSCTAAPIREPGTGRLLGVLDVTGGPAVATPAMLTVVRAAALAAEAELRAAVAGATVIASNGNGKHHENGFPRFPLRSSYPPVRPELQHDGARLDVLGRDNGRLWLHGRELVLSPRHTELLLILSQHPEGLTAEELAVRLFEVDCSPVTIRAEMARLRRLLTSPSNGYGPMIASRPYRLIVPIDTDVADLRRLLERGAHRRALSVYNGPVLPRSEAPDIKELRRVVRRGLRDAILRHANADVLFSYAQSPDGWYDLEVWSACRGRLPAGSPRRTQVESHLRFLDGQLA